MRLLRFCWLMAAFVGCSALQIGCSDGCSEEKQQEESKKEAQPPEKMAPPSPTENEEQPESPQDKKGIRERKLQEVAHNGDQETESPSEVQKEPDNDQNPPEGRRTGRGPTHRGPAQRPGVRDTVPTPTEVGEAPEIDRRERSGAVPDENAANPIAIPVPSAAIEQPSVDLAAQQALLAEAAGGKSGEPSGIPASRAERLAALQKDLNNTAPKRPEPEIVDVPGPEVMEPVANSRTAPSVDRAQRLREQAAPDTGAPHHQPLPSTRTFQPSAANGPPIPIDHALALSELQTISGKQFKMSTLLGQTAGPGYNSLYFSPKVGQDFGVAVQLWHESSIRDTRTRYEQMKASYPNVQETGNITTYTYFAHWKEIYYLVFMDLKKRRVVCVSGSNKALSPNQLFTIATKIRDRLI